MWYNAEKSLERGCIMTNMNTGLETFMDTMASELAFDFSSLLMSVAAYILLSLGVYAIAKRRGISKPWLAWVPFGQSWMLGCVSDQVQYVTMGHEKSKRKLLLWLELSVTAVGIVTMIFWAKGMVGYLNLEQRPTDFLPFGGNRMSEDEILSNLMISAFLACVMAGLAITFAVIKFMALYDLYRSCDPMKATVFTVLSVVLGAVVTGIFVVACRDKDFGMPPRRDHTPFGESVYQLPQQSWQQPQEPKDPWDI